MKRAQYFLFCALVGSVDSFFDIFAVRIVRYFPFFNTPFILTSI